MHIIFFCFDLKKKKKICTFHLLTPCKLRQFKDEVVKEVVERMCSDFSGQCCTHKSSDEHLEASGLSDGPVGPRPGPSTSNRSLGYTPNCSSCNKLTFEGAYKCRLAGVLKDGKYCRIIFVSLISFCSLCIFEFSLFWCFLVSACARPASCVRCADIAMTPATTL